MAKDAAAHGRPEITICAISPVRTGREQSYSGIGSKPPRNFLVHCSELTLLRGGNNRHECEHFAEEVLLRVKDGHIFQERDAVGGNQWAKALCPAVPRP